MSAFSFPVHYGGFFKSVLSLIFGLAPAEISGNINLSRAVNYLVKYSSTLLQYNVKWMFQ